ncbi:MAG: energy-coupling factor ABC transporter ATP-binding protein [Calditrichaeota bacterium]|nr:energy-coupling factor ABC transporter ATP-binding protein [Calditrichota bacterium]MCB9368105.1 energy-coupling factor ABC transporter ATP-binding protein [Calditrichota bacterium]
MNDGNLPLIRIRNLDFQYLPDVPVLRNVNCEFRSGELLYLVGESGSGKSTLAHLVGRILQPTAGSIEFGSDFYPSLVLQFPELLFLFDSIREEFDSLKDPELRLFAKDLVSRFSIDIESLSDIPPTSLSFAQRRVVATALQCARSREVIVLDEPTLGLDERNATVLADWLRETCQDGSCCIVVTHDLELIETAPGNVHILRQGQLKWRGGSTEFLESNDLLSLAGSA